MTISIKDAQGAAGMRLAGRLASEVLDYLTPFVPRMGGVDLHCLFHQRLFFELLSKRPLPHPQSTALYVPFVPSWE